MRISRAARELVTGLMAIAALQAISSVPATHVLVPSLTAVPTLEKLRQQKGAVASVITVAGEEAALTIDPGARDTLAGNRLDPDSLRQVAIIFWSPILQR